MVSKESSITVGEIMRQGFPKEAKIYCPHCYKIIDLEKDYDGVLYVIEENEVE